MKMIGPNFPYELEKAGLIGLPFAWSDDGTITFSKEMTKDQIDAVKAVYSDHDPNSLSNLDQT